MKIAAALPKEGDLNGLAQYDGKVAAEPEAVYVIIARVSVSELRTKFPSGHVEPVLTIEHVELLEGLEREVIESILRRRQDERYGRAPLFDDDEELSRRVSESSGLDVTVIRGTTDPEAADPDGPERNIGK
jgi:hypothetical protein